MRIERYPGDTTLQAVEQHGEFCKDCKVEAVLWVAILFLASEVDSLRDELSKAKDTNA